MSVTWSNRLIRASWKVPRKLERRERIRHSASCSMLRFRRIPKDLFLGNKIRHRNDAIHAKVLGGQPLMHLDRVSMPAAGIWTPGQLVPLGARPHSKRRELGRDTSDKPFADSPFEVIRADDGTVRRVTLRRGTRIAAGQPIGTLNKYGHVHLTMGAPGGEVNPLLVLKLPGFVDTVAPTIEEVVVQTDARVPIVAASAGAPLEVSGRVRVLVRAWDRTDANAERRRLGVHRLGYEVLDAAGARVSGEGSEHPTIAFDRLPRDGRAGQFAYASGSRSWFSGPTVFIYPVTNIVRDGEAKEEFLDVSSLAAGEYTLRVFAEDASGNRTTKSVVLRKHG